MTVKKKIRYTVEPADVEADGKHVRIVIRYEGPYQQGRSPQYIETLTERQACDLRDDLEEVLANL